MVYGAMALRILEAKSGAGRSRSIPWYTPGLEGTPNEIKLKYIADSHSGEVAPEDMADLVKSKIRSKDQNLIGKAESSDDPETVD